MTKDYTAIRVSKASKEQAEAAKRDGETWDEYIQRCTDNPPEIKEFVERGSTQTVGLEATTINQIAEAVEQRLR